MDDVRLPDLEVIRRFSIAVRREHAPAEEVIEALRADLAELTRPGRAKPKREFETLPEPEDVVDDTADDDAEDDEDDEQEEKKERSLPPLFERGSSRRLKPAITGRAMKKPVRKPAPKKPAARKPAAKKKPARRR